MGLNHIHHAAIIVSDYEKSKQFYTGILGLEILKETYREQRQSYKLDLLVGGKYQIELFSFPNPPPRTDRPEACGLRHLAFATPDLNQAHRELQEKGVAAEDIRTDEVTGKKFFFLRILTACLWKFTNNKFTANKNPAHTRWVLTSLAACLYS